jgi:hypothetical protein
MVDENSAQITAKRVMSHRTNSSAIPFSFFVIIDGLFIGKILQNF